jgi:hypothetical protein
MITPSELRERLSKMPNKRAVARMSDIPEKTVYRTASGESEPTLEIACRLVDAMDAIEAGQTEPEARAA